MAWLGRGMETGRGGDSLMFHIATNSELWPGAAHSADLLAALTCPVTHSRCRLTSIPMTRPLYSDAGDSGATLARLWRDSSTALIIVEDLYRGTDAGTVQRYHKSDHVISVVICHSIGLSWHIKSATGP